MHNTSWRVLFTRSTQLALDVVVGAAWSCCIGLGLWILTGLLHLAIDARLFAWAAFALVFAGFVFYLGYLQRRLFHSLERTQLNTVRVDVFYGLGQLRLAEAWVEIGYVSLMVAISAYALGILLAGGDSMSLAWRAWALIVPAVIAVGAAYVVSRLQRLKPLQAVTVERATVGLAFSPALLFCAAAINTPESVPDLFSSSYAICIASAVVSYTAIRIVQWGAIRKHEVVKRAFADAVDAPDSGRTGGSETAESLSIPAQPLSRNDRLKREVIALLKVGDGEKALSKVSEFDQQLPADKKEYYVYKTRILLSVKRPEEALSVVGEFHRFDERARLGSMRMTSYQAVAHMQQGEYRDARRVIRQAINADRPRAALNGYFQMHLGECAFEIAGEKARARAVAIARTRRALACEPACNLYAMERLAFYLALNGGALPESGTDDSRKAELQEALDSIFQSMSLYQRGLGHARRGGITVRDFEAIEGPENASLLATCALVLVQLRQYYLAAKVLRDCVRIAPDAPTPHFGIALLARLTEDREWEHHALCRARKLMPRREHGYLRRVVDARLAEPEMRQVDTSLKAGVRRFFTG